MWLFYGWIGALKRNWKNQVFVNMLIWSRNWLNIFLHFLLVISIDKVSSQANKALENVYFDIAPHLSWWHIIFFKSKVIKGKMFSKCRNVHCSLFICRNEQAQDNLISRKCEKKQQREQCDILISGEIHFCLICFAFSFS